VKLSGSMRNLLSRRAIRIIVLLILASAPAVFMIAGLDLAGSIFSADANVCHAWYFAPR
jgi:hypothetical protein